MIYFIFALPLVAILEIVLLMFSESRACAAISRNAAVFSPAEIRYVGYPCDWFSCSVRPQDEPVQQRDFDRMSTRLRNTPQKGCGRRRGSVKQLIPLAVTAFLA